MWKLNHWLVLISVQAPYTDQSIADWSGISINLHISITLKIAIFTGALFTPGGLNQLANNGIIHSIENVIYPYVSDEKPTTPRPKKRVKTGRFDDPRLVVDLKNGRVRGINLNQDVRAWLGIPYAEPPVGLESNQ